MCIYIKMICRVGRGKYRAGLSPLLPPPPLEASCVGRAPCPPHKWYKTPTPYGWGKGERGGAAGCGAPLPTLNFSLIHFSISARVSFISPSLKNHCLFDPLLCLRNHFLFFFDPLLPRQTFVQHLLFHHSTFCLPH